MPDEFLIQVVLGFFGCGMTIVFCSVCCRVYGRLRSEQLERAAQRRSEQRNLHNIYVIPFPRSISRQDSIDSSVPPRYSTTTRYEAPPSYNELVIKLDDLPPPYTEQYSPDFAAAHTPAHINTAPSQVLSQP